MTFTAIAISGSLRRESLNTSLLHMAIRLAPNDLEIELVNWIDELPWMNPDQEAALPDVVSRWHACVAGADALIIGLPEYNGHPPALIKNAFDWATRPFGAHPLRGKAIALLSAAGRGGGRRSQESFAVMATQLGNHVVDDAPVQVIGMAEHIAADGASADASVETAVTAKLQALVRRLRSSTPE